MMVVGTMVWLGFSLLCGGVSAVFKAKNPTDWLLWLAVVAGAVFVLGMILFWSIRAYMYFHGMRMPIPLTR